MSLVVIYHGDCNDGFCAAWVARRWRPDAELVPCQHGDVPPDVSGREVLIVDFSFPRDTLLAMHRDARSLRLLDHHVTAREALGDLSYCTFDLERAGAGLAWDVLFDGAPRPWLVDYVEDRDLWRFVLPDTHAINAALAAAPHDLAHWDRLAARPAAALVADGHAILGYQRRLVERILDRAHRATIAGHDVPVVNCPVLRSDLGQALSLGEPFAAIYADGADGEREYSLRSQPDGLDVAAIARGLGGGGHPRAAGFRGTNGAGGDASDDPSGDTAD